MGKCKKCYPYGLTQSDMNIYIDGRLVIHRVSNELSIGSIHRSLNCGLFKILSVDHIDKYSRKYYKIRFIKTGYICITDVSHIKTGSIKDHLLPSLLIGKQYINNIGKPYTIAGYHISNGRLMVDIEFISGYKTTVRFDNVEKGSVKDKISPTVYGIGYLGDNHLELCNSDKKLYYALKTRWISMLYRCYKPDDPNYIRYGSKGVTVDARWHNFSNFIKDCVELDGFNRDKIVLGYLQLDKDKYQKNIPMYNKIYSKNTCCWLSAKENNMINVNKN